MTKQRSRSTESNNRVEDEKGRKSTDTVIVAALIGLAGTIVTAIIGFFAMQYQANIPIHATEMAQTIAIKTNIQTTMISAQTTQMYITSQTLAAKSHTPTISAPAATATDLPTTDTPLPPAVTEAPSPAATDTPTPTATPAPVSISNCASENEWMVNPALRNAVFKTDGGCLELSKFHITVSDGLKIDFANNEGGKRTYNLYLSEKVTAPLKAAFTLKAQEMSVLPKDGDDLSIYAGFVEGSNNEPDWLLPYYVEDKQGNFILLRLPGTIVKKTGSQRTRFLYVDDNIHNLFDTEREKTSQMYNGTTQSIDIELHYRKDAVVFSWRSEGQVEWTQVTSGDVPDPAYFVFGYSAPEKSKVNAWISNITIQPGEDE